MSLDISFVKEYAAYSYPKQCGIACSVNHTEGQYPLHRHDYLEFEYLVEGRIEHELNGTRCTLTPGAFWCLGRHDMHRLTVLEPVVIHNICVHYRSAPAAVQQLTGSAHFPLVGFFSADQLAKINRLFSQLAGTIQKESTYSEARIGAYLTLILTEMLESGTSLTDKPLPSGYRHIAAAIEFMSQNFASELTLKEVAAHVYLSETYFSKLFAEISGSSFLVYLTDLRLDRAKELLAATTLPITQIALECGFGSFSTFSRIFKSRCGCSPSDYRKQTEQTT